MTVESQDRFAVGSRTQSPPVAPPPFPGTDAVDPNEVFSSPGYTGPPPPRNSVAVVALWLTVFFIFLPPLLVVSGILGVWGLVLSETRQGVGRRAGLAALVVSVLAGVLWGAIILFTVYGG